ncbi:MAG: hypothetical protein ABIE03_02350 [Patescibacteria group bacterium]|nr:hypothetical protein [Patescibacteria group bacterium]
MKTLQLPESVRYFVNQYFNLLLNGKKVRCPYYINIKKYRQRMNLRVLIGKGSPEEIIQESLIFEKLRGVDFANMTVGDIREFLVKRRLGIDCSGFVVQILDYWLRSERKKHLWNYLEYPKQSLYRKIARILRPVENIPANYLSGDLNSEKISDLNKILPGDIIRSKIPKRAKGLLDQFHVLLISEVVKDDNDTVVSFKYVHSTRFYRSEHGVRVGEVRISDPSASLCSQEWIDALEGRNFTKEEICSAPDYSHVRRLIHVPLYQ